MRCFGMSAQILKRAMLRTSNWIVTSLTLLCLLLHQLKAVLRSLIG